MTLQFPERSKVLNTVGLENNMRHLETPGLLTWNDCKSIWDDYNSDSSARAEICDSLLLELQKLSETSYFIKVRQKEPVSLIRKIVNNKFGNLEKYGPLNPQNYRMFVTDLIGARILIRSKAEWLSIHKQLCEAFDKEPRQKIVTTGDYVTLYCDDPNARYFAEEPVAYIVSKNESSLYVSKGKDIIKPKESDRGYRSIHYIVKYFNYYVEIQVRSIFEEGWSECDHELVYKTPEGRKKDTLRSVSKVISELAHQADELIEFMNALNIQQPNNCNYPNDDCYAIERGGNNDSTK